MQHTTQRQHTTQTRKNNTQWGTCMLIVIITLISAQLSGTHVSNTDSSSSSFLFVSATTPVTNTTDLNQDGGLLNSLPVSNLVAIILVCAFILLVCLCLFCAARNQMASTDTSGTKGAALNSKLQAKLDAARKGWKKAEGKGRAMYPPNCSLAGMAMRGASTVELLARSAELQHEETMLYSGGGLHGLGVCRYHHFVDPDEFLDELWATPGTREALKRTGCMLDVVITSQHVMYMSGLSGLVPFALLCIIPFHKMILAKLSLSDWYGPILSVDFLLCMLIAGGGCAVHFFAYLCAKFIFDYDRAPSIAAEKEQWRLLQRAAQLASAAQRTQIVPGSPTSAATAQQGGENSTGATGMGNTLSPRNGGSINAGNLSSPTSPSNLTDPNSVVPPTFLGKEPSVWPLRILCFSALLAYGVLGFLAYVSCDESGCRQYGITSTNAHYFPPTAGKGPAITFILCVCIGCTSMVPLAFALKLLALFTPRKVHPHLM